MLIHTHTHCYIAVSSEIKTFCLGRTLNETQENYQQGVLKDETFHSAGKFTKLRK